MSENKKTKPKENLFQKIKNKDLIITEIYRFIPHYSKYILPITLFEEAELTTSLTINKDPKYKLEEKKAYDLYLVMYNLITLHSNFFDCEYKDVYLVKGGISLRSKHNNRIKAFNSSIDFLYYKYLFKLKEFVNGIEYIYGHIFIVNDFFPKETLDIFLQLFYKNLKKKNFIEIYPMSSDLDLQFWKNVESKNAKSKKTYSIVLLLNDAYNFKGIQNEINFNNLNITNLTIDCQNNINREFDKTNLENCFCYLENYSNIYANNQQNEKPLNCHTICEKIKMALAPYQEVLQKNKNISIRFREDLFMKQITFFVQRNQITKKYMLFSNEEINLFKYILEVFNNRDNVSIDGDTLIFDYNLLNQENMDTVKYILSLIKKKNEKKLNVLLDFSDLNSNEKLSQISLWSNLDIHLFFMNSKNVEITNDIFVNFAQIITKLKDELKGITFCFNSSNENYNQIIEPFIKAKTHPAFKSSKILLNSLNEINVYFKEGNKYVKNNPTYGIYILTLKNEFLFFNNPSLSNLKSMELESIIELEQLSHLVKKNPFLGYIKVIDIIVKEEVNLDNIRKKYDKVKVGKVFDEILINLNYLQFFGTAQFEMIVYENSIYLTKLKYNSFHLFSLNDFSNFINYKKNLYYLSISGFNWYLEDIKSKTLEILDINYDSANNTINNGEYRGIAKVITKNTKKEINLNLYLPKIKILRLRNDYDFINTLDLSNLPASLTHIYLVHSFIDEDKYIKLFNDKKVTLTYTFPISEQKVSSVINSKENKIYSKSDLASLFNIEDVNINPNQEYITNISPFYDTITENIVQLYGKKNELNNNFEETLANSVDGDYYECFE